MIVSLIALVCESEGESEAARAGEGCYDVIVGASM